MYKSTTGSSDLGRSIISAWCLLIIGRHGIHDESDSIADHFCAEDVSCHGIDIVLDAESNVRPLRRCSFEEVQKGLGAAVRHQLVVCPGAYQKRLARHGCS